MSKFHLTFRIFKNYLAFLFITFNFSINHNPKVDGPDLPTLGGLSRVDIHITRPSTPIISRFELPTLYGPNPSTLDHQ